MARPKDHSLEHRSESHADFMEEFVMESDRAAVILGASKIDNLLGEILDKFLLPLPGSEDDLLEGDSPLGTFSARIKACYRLGLIDDQLAKLLNTFRRLRNGFAHESTSSSLSVGSARDRVASMVEPFINLPFYNRLQVDVAKQMQRTTSDSGVMFRAVLSLFHMHLGYVHAEVTPLKRSVPVGVVDGCRNVSRSVAKKAKVKAKANDS